MSKTQIKSAPVDHIRWMIRRDMPEVVAMESHCFADFPWTEEDFIRCLRQRNCIGMVVERDEKLVGYMIYELHRNRLEILNLGVDPQYRRQGVGAKMLGKLIGKLSPQRRSRILATIREENLPAHLWMKACGFMAVSISREHFNSGEDGYVFEYYHEE